MTCVFSFIAKPDEQFLPRNRLIIEENRKSIAMKHSLAGSVQQHRKYEEPTDGTAALSWRCPLLASRRRRILAAAVLRIGVVSVILSPPRCSAWAPHTFPQPSRPLSQAGTIRCVRGHTLPILPASMPPQCAGRRLMLPLSAAILPPTDMDLSHIVQTFGRALSSLGSSLSGEPLEIVPEAATDAVLESLGRDLIVFLSASVVVTPLASALGFTPILGYLVAGAVLGPHALDVFSNAEADVELGDFGVLFLLFSEGLEVTTSRISKLTTYLPLGLAQMTLTTGVLTTAILIAAPRFLERFAPQDAGLINFHNPVEVLVLALAGTLSTSAFVFPVLNEKGWEEEPAGQAATSVLLLQDLAVAPLLAVLPYIVGTDPTDYGSLWLLALRVTVGFGTVVLIGSFVLRRLFALVAETRSSETFVALCLLVAAGMGSLAQSLGLTDTAGAFAAGVLLANTNYRAQIQADILPFKGILLGVFFMEAGSRFDASLVLSEFPIVIAGVTALLLLKSVTLLASTRVPRWMEANRLEPEEAARLALLLSGGGEFAFVVLAAAERLGVLPTELGGLLTAVVLISMAVTPFLAEMTDEAAALAASIFPTTQGDMKIQDEGGGEKTGVAEVCGDAVTMAMAPDAVLVCGYNAVGQSVLSALAAEFRTPDGENLSTAYLAAFDSDPSLATTTAPLPVHSAVLYGDGSNPNVLRSYGFERPPALFVAYDSPAEREAATARLRSGFPKAAIYVWASSRKEAIELRDVGATEVAVEGDNLAGSALALLQLTKTAGVGAYMEGEKDMVGVLRKGRKDVVVAPIVDTEPGRWGMRRAVANATGLDLAEVDMLIELFDCMDKDASGTVEGEELAAMLRKSNSGITSDVQIVLMEGWVRRVAPASMGFVGFCQLFVKAPETVKIALGDACIL